MENSGLWRSFEWPVDSDGYVIVQRGGTGEDLLSSFRYEVIRGRGGAQRLYQPMECEPGLWREFAETCRGAEEALKFSNKFGLLLDQEACHVDLMLNWSAHVRNIASLMDSHRRDAAIEQFNNLPHARASVCIENGELRPRPSNLLSALLIQTGEALTGGHTFRACQNPKCQRWIKVGTGASTIRRKFCSDRCRVAVDRAKAKR
jgi:hypothetical protein